MMKRIHHGVVDSAAEAAETRTMLRGGPYGWMADLVAPAAGPTMP